ncbi:hypothetical protein VKT23_019723, partial [Stygiomarasmius scandens]
MESSTRATKALLSRINVLFLHDVNPDLQVQTIEELPIESTMRFRHLGSRIAALVEHAFKSKVDPEKLKFFKPKNPLPITGAKAWAKEHPDLDDAQQVQYTQLLSDVLDLDNIGWKDVDLIINGMVLEDDAVEEELPSSGPYQPRTTYYQIENGRIDISAPHEVPAMTLFGEGLSVATQTGSIYSSQTSKDDDTLMRKLLRSDQRSFLSGIAEMPLNACHVIHAIRDKDKQLRAKKKTFL